MCTVPRARCVIIGLAVIAVLLYNYALWTSQVQYSITNTTQTDATENTKNTKNTENTKSTKNTKNTEDTVKTDQGFCAPLPEYLHLATSFNSVDTVLTLIIPYFAIFVLNVRIILAVITIHQERRHLNVQGSNSNGYTPAPLVVTAAGNGSHINHTGSRIPDVSDEHHTRQEASNSSSIRKALRLPTLLSNNNAAPHPSQVKVTKTLVLVSTIFLLLNLPSHAIRLYNFLMACIDEDYYPTKLFLLLQKLFQLIYYINFGINFFLYQSCGRNFRRALMTTLKKVRLKKLLNFKFCSHKEDKHRDLENIRPCATKLCRFRDNRNCNSSSERSSNCHPPPLHGPPHFNDFLGKTAHGSDEQKHKDDYEPT